MPQSKQSEVYNSHKLTLSDRATLHPWRLFGVAVPSSVEARGTDTTKSFFVVFFDSFLIMSDGYAFTDDELLAILAEAGVIASATG
jgi:hypothetical protein